MSRFGVEEEAISVPSDLDSEEVEFQRTVSCTFGAEEDTATSTPDGLEPDISEEVITLDRVAAG